jgi:hypothetical protein
MVGIPFKVEKAMIRKLPAGPGDMLMDVASAALGAAASVGGFGDMLPVVWGPEEFHFRFNPKELSTSSTMRMANTPSQGDTGGHRVQYGGSEPADFTVTFLLDEWESPPGMGQNVRDMVKQLEDLQLPDPVIRRPARVMFVWGSFNVTGFMKTVGAQYQLFGQDGTPLRATVTLTIQQHDPDPAGTNPTSGGPPGRRARTIVDGDSLPLISYSEYGDPNLWRALAEANALDDPFKLNPGLELMVPSREDAEAYR